MAEGAHVHKIGQLAQTLMATIADDPELDGCEVTEAAIVCAIRIPAGHDLNEGAVPDTAEYIYRVAGPIEPWAKIGLFHIGLDVADAGDGIEEPEPPA